MTQDETRLSMPPEVTVHLEEYRALRNEVLQSIRSRLEILSFGLATLGVLIGLSLQDKVIDTDFAGFVLAVFVPAAGCIIVIEWLSEVQRAKRASNHLWGIERRVNHALQEPALSWEESLRSSQYQHMRIFRYHHWAVVSFFTGVPAAAAWWGVKQWGFPEYWQWLWAIVVFMMFVSFFVPRVLHLREYDQPDPAWRPRLDGKGSDAHQTL